MASRPMMLSGVWGVDVIAHYKLPFGNTLKKSITDRMYRRCGDPGQDEPAENRTEE